MPKITMIPARVDPLTRLPMVMGRKRRVAGYARVSTDSDEQFTSYEAQIDYYTQYILRNPEWEFVKVYTDEGISATNTKHRDGFNTMIADALAGKIDLIVTKSVSRFARNTVDSLITIRKLKEKRVEVFFEKENIYTLDSQGELMITIMSSMAQEESRSISENVTWGQRKRFADGKVRLPYKKFLGYRKGENDIPEIVPEEAEIIREIYSMFICGQTSGAIAKHLTDSGIPTPGGKQNWPKSTVESILRNEKYKGDALLQKEFTVDFLTKKKKKNEGEVPQYYVEHSHPPIISPEEWDAVQKELARRKALGQKYSCGGALAAKLVCADCGEFFGPKTWHSTDKYRKVIWRCTHKYEGDRYCSTPHLHEADIKAHFVTAVNALLSDVDSILEDCRVMQMIASDCGKIDEELSELSQEMEVVSELVRRCVEENSRFAQDQSAFQERYNGLVARFNTAKERHTELQKQRADREQCAEEIGAFMFEISELKEPIAEFDEPLWRTIVEKVTVHRDGRLVFHFFGGQEITT